MKTTTNSKSNTAWQLEHKESGKLLYKRYNTRKAAAQATERFSNYTPVKVLIDASVKTKSHKVTKAGDGGIDPKKLKKGKPAPTPKSIVESEGFFESFSAFEKFINWLRSAPMEEVSHGAGIPDTLLAQTPIKESNFNTMSKTRTTKPVSTKPKLRSGNSAPGAKFHKHGTFGVK